MAMRPLQSTVLLLLGYFAFVAFSSEKSILQQYAVQGNGDKTVAKKTISNATKIQSNDKQNQDDTSSLKVAIYMTTHMSEQQVQFLQECWPAAIAHLRLVRMADLIVYTSSKDSSHDINFFRRLGFENHIDLHHYKELFLGQQEYASLDTGNVNNNSTALSKEYDLQRQDGAIRAMVDPFLTAAASDADQQHFSSSSTWFDGYNWILRLNPDVLIRRDAWLLQQLHNTSIDGIFVDWRYHYRSGRFKGNRLHTDFFAFRPTAANGTALAEYTQSCWL